jgi:hypothetical protein
VVVVQSEMQTNQTGKRVDEITTGKLGTQAEYCPEVFLKPG